MVHSIARRSKSNLGDYNAAVEFRLRESRPEDFDSLWRIDHQCFPAGISYSRRELAYYMGLRGAFTVVAENADAGAIAGFLVAQRMAKDMGHIVTLDVLRDYRRHQLGTRLMTAAEQRLKQAGCRSIYLEAAVDNAAAIAFYKRLGYFVLKVIPHYYQGKLDAFLMAKAI